MAEVRFAARRLGRSPGYTLTIVATLALTIGACTAVFSAVRAILLNANAVAAPEELVVLWGADLTRNLPVVELSYRNFVDWTRNTSSVAQAAAMGSSAWPTILEKPGPPTRVSAAGVTSSFFATLQVPPWRGRLLRAEDEVPNAPHVIVISHRLWAERFGSDERVIGRPVRVADGEYTVVGVMPEAFDFPRGTDLWMPVVPVLAGTPTGWNDDGLKNVGVLYVIARLRPGVTIPAAADELERRAAAASADRAVPRFGTRLVITPFAEYLFGPTRRVLWLLLASVLVLLLIGCSNIVSVMLTRAFDRELEHSVRRACGATSAAFVRAWMVESLLLSVAGGAVGLLLAAWLVRMIVLLAPDDVPHVANVAINPPVAAFCLAATLFTSLLCGVWPARRAAASQPAEALRLSSRTTAAPRVLRLRSALVAAQVALVVVLLIAASLVLRSFENLERVDLGFSPSGVVTLNVTPRTLTGPPNVWMAALAERLRSLPSVEAAGAVFLRPLSRGPIGQEAWVVLEGQEPDGNSPSTQNPALNYEVATPSYFDTMRIPILRGRLFSSDDVSGARPVALVSASAAARLWPHQDAIGKRLLLPTFASQGPDRVWRTVVGVVANVRYRGLDDERFDVNVPASSDAQTTSDLVVRASGDPAALAREVQARIRRFDPEVIIDGVASMEDIVRRARAPWALGAWMFSVFAALAVVLALVGLTGLLSLEVAHRRHEFAIRQAIGARPVDIGWFIIGRSAWRVLVGTSGGLLGAAVASRFLQSLLYGIEGLDPLTYVSVSASVILVGLAATLGPVRRATHGNLAGLLR